MCVQSCGLAIDAVVLKGPPVAVGVDRPQLQHGLGSGHFPTHPRTFRAILDHVTASAPNDPCGDRISGPQVVVVTHAVQIVLREITQPSQTLRGDTAKIVFGSRLTQAADDPSGRAFQHALEPLPYELAGGVASLSVEKVGGRGPRIPARGL